MPRIATFSSLKRPSQTREVASKYFFVMEGVKTEVRYVEALICRKSINSHVFYFYRSKSNNLLSLTNEVLDAVAYKTTSLDMTYSALADFLCDISMQKSIIVNKSTLLSRISKYANSLGKNLSSAVTPDEIKTIVNKFADFVKTNLLSILDESDLIEACKKVSTFDVEIDHVILIGDRDRGSFTDKQYVSVLNKIEGEKWLHLIISNPCIEFWFLLHHTNGKGIDMSGWNEDKDAASKVMKELKKFDRSYSKERFKADFYLSKISTATENSRLYASDLKELQNEIGTNIPSMIDLIDKMA